MTNKHNPECSVIIPAYNEAEIIEATLKSLSQQTIDRDRYEIIVVDNGSTDRTVEIAKIYADFVLIKNKGNVGAVRNYGVSKSNSSNIICTDADCLFSENWIERGLHLLKENKNSVFGGGLKSPADASWVEKKWLLNPTGNAAQQKSLMGSCIFIRKKDFMAVGGFEENITSGEDSDLSEKLQALGIKIVSTSELSVIHDGGAQTIADFVKRQMWHSENYFRTPKKLYKDKIFIITLVYTFSVLAFPISLVNGKLYISAITSFLIFACTATNTLKRLYRTKYTPNSFLDLFSIHILDHFYLMGRAIGSFRGLVKR